MILAQTGVRPATPAPLSTFITPTGTVPNYRRKVALRLVEGHVLVFYEVADNAVKVTELFTLHEFSIQRSAVRWTITSSTGAMFEGASAPTRVAGGLTAWVEFPLHLTMTPYGLSLPITFGVPEGYRVMELPWFKRLMGE